LRPLNRSAPTWLLRARRAEDIYDAITYDVKRPIWVGVDSVSRPADALGPEN
jgi:hypothetical protein